jgi:hypothetical protein
MKRKVKRSKTMTLRTCNLCGHEVKGTLPVPVGGIVQRLVDHYEEKHPDRMADCFDAAGQTWNSQYDACLKALHQTSRQRDDAIKQRDEAVAQQRSLAAKLNAIVLVLRGDS